MSARVEADDHLVPFVCTSGQVSPLHQYHSCKVPHPSALYLSLCRRCWRLPLIFPPTHHPNIQSMSSAGFSRLAHPLGALVVLCLFGAQSGLARHQNALRASGKSLQQTDVGGKVVWVEKNEGDTKITKSNQDGEQLLVSMMLMRVESDPCAVPLRKPAQQSVFLLQVAGRYFVPSSGVVILDSYVGMWGITVCIFYAYLRERSPRLPSIHVVPLSFSAF